MIKTHLKGFTLLELAIVLVIIGIVAGLGLPSLVNLMNRDKVITTGQNQQYVLQALAGYLLTYHHLPCPASPIGSGAERGKAPSQCDSPEQAQGIIPFRTLGIPEAKAKDGYKNWMTYAIHPLLGNKLDLKSLLIDESGAEPPENSFCGIKADALEAGISKINIVDQSHNPLLVKVFNSHSLIPHDFIAVVLISHGSKGEGAYTSVGTRNSIKQEGADKAENSNNDFLFVDRQKSVDFDDTVVWVTRNNLMATYVQKPCRTK